MRSPEAKQKTVPSPAMNPSHELESLASRYIDGRATRADMQRLETLLRSDHKLLEQFVAFLNLDSGLAAYAAAWPIEQADADSGLRIGLHARLGSTVLRWFWAASLLIAVIGAAAAMTVMPWSRTKTAQSDGTAEDAADPPYAVLAATADAFWADPTIEVAMRRGLMPSGPARLVSGEVEILFASGGTAVITGPAIFEAIAADTLRLTIGSVRCRCPRPGTELRVETPTGTVIDLGTEFAVSVEPGDRMRVGVIEGKVQLDVATSSRLILAGEAVSVDAAGQSTEDNGFLQDVVRETTLARFDRNAVARGLNLLVDPSFESHGATDAAAVKPSRVARPRGSSGGFPIGPWLATMGYVEQVSVPTATGGKAVRLHARGKLSWPLIVQEIATGDIVGQTVMASVKAAHLADDPLTGRQSAIVKLVFVNRDGREFAKAERHFLRAGTPVDRFVEAGIAAVAPPGTVAVHCQVLLDAWGCSTGSIIADDAAVVVVGPDGL